MMNQLVVIAVVVLLHQTIADPGHCHTTLVSQSSNQFANQLYQELAKRPGNVLVCPLSVHIALALVHQGAGGTTASELANVLRLIGCNDHIKNSYKTLLTELQDDVLKIATKLYPAISFTPKKDYVSVAQQYFFSDIEALNYNNPTNAAATINKFVEDKTNNRIHDIISPDALTDLTRLIIVNAVHFKADWAKPFPPAIEANFKVSPTETVRTTFLTQTDEFPYKDDSALGAKVLMMDYVNGKYSMVFVLPNQEDGLAALETKLANTSVTQLLDNLKNARVDVTIPKFKIEQEMELKEALSKMGIVSMFGNRANLSGIATGESLAVDSVIQKTFIDVNEKGTEAAAATGFITALSGNFEENIFNAQRPFHFCLLHNQSPKFILFKGRMVRPDEKTKASSIESVQTTKNDDDDGKISFSEKVEGDLEPNIANQSDILQNQGINTGISEGGQGYAQSPYPASQTVPQNYGQVVGYGPSETHNQQYGPQNLGETSQPIGGYIQSQNPTVQNIPYNHGQNSQTAHGYNQNPNLQASSQNYGQYGNRRFLQSTGDRRYDQNGYFLSHPAQQYGVQQAPQPGYQPGYLQSYNKHQLYQSTYQPQHQTNG